MQSQAWPAFHGDDNFLLCPLTCPISFMSPQGLQSYGPTRGAQQLSHGDLALHCHCAS